MLTLSNLDYHGKKMLCALERIMLHIHLRLIQAFCMLQQTYYLIQSVQKYVS